MSINSNLTAVYKDQTSAIEAYELLTTNNIESSSISILHQDPSNSSKLIVKDEQSVAKDGLKDASIGALAGASLLSAGAAIVTTLSGGTALLGAGPLIATLTSAVAGAAGGGLIGGLVSMGMSETKARELEESLDKGMTALNIESSDEQKIETSRELIKKTSGKIVGE